ncbi:MAG: (4Fe-4S)-binding protein [Anaerotruncus sp.]|nr:(4Fe-4S)-binding protein [Anaerotruncus sp.]
MAKVKPDEIKRVKAMGCLFNRDSEDEFNVRVITVNGTLTGEQLACISSAAEKFGNGRVAMTVRLAIEIMGVKLENIPALQQQLATAGLYTGGTGDKIRPVTSCKGTTCVFGQVDTQGIAASIHKRFYEGWNPEITLPHKFKIAVGGCPNNCAKPDLNDFGLIGQRRPQINEERCHGCKKCIVTEGCQMGAPQLVDGKITIDREKCNSCGKCIRNCYFQCLEDEAHGVKIVLGGKWGRKHRSANELPGIYSVEEAMDILEKALLLFRKYGYVKERFGDMIDRIGWDKVQQELLGDTLLAEKESILAAPIQVRP